MMPFQTGFVISIGSLFGLSADISSLGMKLRLLMLTKNTDDIPLTNKAPVKDVAFGSSSGCNEEDFETFLLNELLIDIVDSSSLAHKCQHIDSSLGSATENIPPERMNKWLQICLNGRLMMPSEPFLDLCKQFQLMFILFHKKSGKKALNQCEGVQRHLISIISEKYPNSDKRIISCYVLRSGGTLLFSDYGIYDAAMLRLKPGHKLMDNFYVRQNGTRAYYFSKEMVNRVFTESGFVVETNNYVHRRTVNLK
ncbi:hypothetical protein CHUAL_013512 [Chamberlinius hualienensis]